MNVPDLLVVAALLLALVDEYQAEWRSKTGWAVILIAIALLWAVIERLH